jgi:hypothetical protein
MMHGPEKSDSARVAVKPMNKAERSVAELALAEKGFSHRGECARAGRRTG